MPKAKMPKAPMKGAMPPKNKMMMKLMEMTKEMQKTMKTMMK